MGWVKKKEGWHGKEKRVGVGKGEVGEGRVGFYGEVQRLSLSSSKVVYQTGAYLRSL